MTKRPGCICSTLHLYGKQKTLNHFAYICLFSQSVCGRLGSFDIVFASIVFLFLFFYRHLPVVVSVSLYLSVYPSVIVSFCLSVCWSLCQFVCLCLSLSVCACLSGICVVWVLVFECYQSFLSFESGLLSTRPRPTVR